MKNFEGFVIENKLIQTQSINNKSIHLELGALDEGGDEEIGKRNSIRKTKDN
jgi:hypothetical protein